MQKNILYTMLILTFIVGFATGAVAEMGSANYRIPTLVMSGGGTPGVNQLSNKLHPGPAFAAHARGSALFDEL